MKRNDTHLTLAARETLEMFLFVTVSGWFTYGLWAVASLPALPGV